jgi:protein-disulfide isomerase
MDVFSVGARVVVLLHRLILLLVLICLGCSAQSAAPDQVLRIEREVRVYYTIPPNVKITVGPLRPSEFPGYSAMTIHMDGGDKKQDYEFLLSKDGKTLLRLTKLDLTKDPYAEIMKKISLAGRPVRGNRDAKVTIVSFDDFECPFCSRMHQMLFPGLLSEYGDRVQFIYKDFPLADSHPWAIHAAVDANCLAVQNNDAYWEFADYIHRNQQEVSREKAREDQFAALDRLTTEQGKKRGLDQAKLESCIKAQNEDAVQASIKEGEGLGVNGTPTLFVNGQELDGAVPVGDVRAAIDRALEQAGIPVPAHPTSSASSESPSARP